MLEKIPWRKKRKPFSAWQIELTTRCPLRCKMCIRSENNDWQFGDMSLEGFKKILPYLDQVETVILEGWGESLLHQDLTECIRLANQEGAHVGNFVELKKTTLGKGSKANHLTYLGDAVIGQGVNIGAGTITCNYDGVNKHQTVIEDGVFIGSDSSLVAPVKIGQGAYVGAGSTITEDVPAHALALSRVRQVLKLEPDEQQECHHDFACGTP